MSADKPTKERTLTSEDLKVFLNMGKRVAVRNLKNLKAAATQKVQEIINSDVKAAADIRRKVNALCAAGFSKEEALQITIELLRKNTEEATRILNDIRGVSV